MVSKQYLNQVELIRMFMLGLNPGWYYYKDLYMGIDFLFPGSFGGETPYDTVKARMNTRKDIFVNRGDEKGYFSLIDWIDPVDQPDGSALSQAKESVAVVDDPESSRAIVTAASFGMNSQEQLRLALEAIIKNDGSALIHQIYEAIEMKMNGNKLSKQGMATLRTDINREAVRLGYVHRFDKDKPGWRITDKGRQFVALISLNESADNGSGVAGISLLNGQYVAFEGEEYLKVHRGLERDQELIRRAKAHWEASGQPLRCVVCCFDFEAAYGERGAGYIEAHHREPLSERPSPQATRIEDLEPLCANCHRMIHVKRPWVKSDELRKQYLAARNRQKRG